MSSTMRVLQALTGPDLGTYGRRKGALYYFLLRPGRWNSRIPLYGAEPKDPYVVCHYRRV